MCPGDWGEFFSPVFFGCVFHFPFSMYVLFKTVLSFFVFLVIQDAVTHKRTNSDIETDPWHTNHLCSWVGYSEHHQCWWWTPRPWWISVSRKERKPSNTSRWRSRTDFSDPRFESWRCEMISCIIFATFCLTCIEDQMRYYIDLWCKLRSLGYIGWQHGCALKMQCCDTFHVRYVHDVESMM